MDLDAGRREFERLKALKEQALSKPRIRAPHGKWTPETLRAFRNSRKMNGKESHV